MKSMFALMRKEYIEAIRTGKIIIVILLFVLFGIMNPAIAKLTPWMMEVLSDSLAENGLIITNVHVNALTSWTQFFKNILIALIAFTLIFSDIFTKEYNSGTLLLILAKGLSRYKVILAKTMLLVSIWTVGYGLCFSITYGYNAYFWDNSIATHLVFSMILWWLFGMWVICLITLFSSFLKNNTSVSMCIGGSVLLAYIWSILPNIKWYSPAMLIDIDSLLVGVVEISVYIDAIVCTVILCILCIAIGVLLINKRQL